MVQKQAKAHGLTPDGIASGDKQQRQNTPVLALDLGTQTGWAVQSAAGVVSHGTENFDRGRFSGGGIRFLRFEEWLGQMVATAGIGRVVFEEVRGHRGTDAAHVYGGMLAILTAYCEKHAVPYEGVGVGVWKKNLLGKGNAGKPAVVAGVKALGYWPSTEDEADAIGILTWAI